MVSFLKLVQNVRILKEGRPRADFLVFEPLAYEGYHRICEHLFMLVALASEAA